MKDIALRVFNTEIESLQKVARQLDDEFDRVIKAILSAKGKLVVTGIGKSGLIGKKIAATLSSTGTSSFFLHPGEAFHGDLGMIGKQDVVLMISYSGETDEILKLIPFLKWNSNLLISLTGNPKSTLARNSNYHLNIAIEHEACPLKLAPTSSTTAALVMGDAIAVALMESRNFREADFARFHPGGSLGHKLLAKVKDKMRMDNLPFISVGSLVLLMSEGRIGMVIVGKPERVEGVVTDGDLRRALVKVADTSKLHIHEMMSTNPVIVDEDEYINNAEHLMLEKKIATVLVGSAGKRTITGVYQLYNV
jgi:arabinose-5-phosphate isomerase